MRRCPFSEVMETARRMSSPWPLSARVPITLTPAAEAAVGAILRDHVDPAQGVAEDKTVVIHEGAEDT